MCYCYGSTSGVPSLHIGHLSDVYVGISIFASETVGTPKSIGIALRSMIKAAATVCAWHRRLKSISLSTEPPVVRTSSTTTIRSRGSILNPGRRIIRSPLFSPNRARAPNSFATSCQNHTTDGRADDNVNRLDLDPCCDLGAKLFRVFRGL